MGGYHCGGAKALFANLKAACDAKDVDLLFAACDFLCKRTRSGANVRNTNASKLCACSETRRRML